MKEKVQAVGLKLWNDFRGFSPGQKAVTLAAVAGLIVGGYFLVTWTPATTYAPLYTNLAAPDASAIVSKLSSQGISYQLANGGTEILVPQAKVDAARLTMSAAGLPGSAQTGYSLLDKEGVTTSQFKQQIDYQRAVEGELAKTIQSINGVTSASVHLSIPQQDVFNDNSEKPTAAVLLGVNPASPLTASQVQSVAYLVSSSVPGLTTNAVAISDSNGNVLNAPGSGLNGLASADSQAKATQAYDDQMAASIQNILDKSLGPNHAVVTVNSTLDFNQTKMTKRQYIYNKLTPPVSQSQTKEVYKGAGASGGSLGVTTDTTTGGTTAGGNGQYAKTSNTVDNALGTLTQTTQNAPGQLQKLSIAVMLDKSAKNLNVGAISNLVKSGVGFNPARGDTFSAQAVTFDNSATKAAKAAAAAAAKAAAASASRAQLMGWAKQGVLVLLIAGLIIGAILAGRKRNGKKAEPDDDVLDLDEPEDLPNDASPAPLAPVKDFSSAAVRRREVVGVADDRPQDVARVLSSWINTKETDR